MAARKFTKADIIDALYEKTGLSRTEIRSAVDLFLEEIKEALIRRQIIELRGFGTFEIKVRKARQRARNPKTGESIVVHSHGTVSFRSGRELKQAVWAVNENQSSCGELSRAKPDNNQIEGIPINDNTAN